MYLLFSILQAQSPEVPPQSKGVADKLFFKPRLRNPECTKISLK